MAKKTILLERVEKLDVWKQAALVFAAGLIARLALDFLFMARYGWHAVNHIETWFYYGVAKGLLLPAGGVADPTVWILRVWSLLLPGELPLYGVVLTSAVLSSLTAAAIYLLGREQYNSRTGLIAGLIYAFMVEPIALSLVGFTHDHLQLLIFVLVLLATVLAVKSTGWKRIAYAATFALLVYSGIHISPVVEIAAGFSIVYVFIELIRRRTDKSMYGKYFLFMLAVIVVSSILLIPPIIESSLELMPQGRSGSIDIAPISLSNFWLRFNILLMLLPLAFLAGYEKKDVNALNLTITGLILCTIMDRGARILDLGIAMLTAQLLVSWKDKFNRLFAISAVIILLFFLTQTATSIRYNATYAIAGMVMMAVMWMLKGEYRVQAALSLLLMLGFVVNLIYVYSADAKTISPEAEYTTFKWLGTQDVKSKVLAGWDRGYYLKAVAGVTPVSTPNRIDYPVHDLLWLPEDQAAVGLAKAGVEYVIITDKNFNIVRNGGTYSFALSGGLVLEPTKAPAIGEISGTAIYKLRNGDANPRYFTMVKEFTDNKTDVTYTVYKITSST